MGKVFDGIDDHLRGWIGRQRVFFVGTAPLAADGHINVSPKGPIDSLAVLDEHTVAYLDIVGSGAETIAHLRAKGPNAYEEYQREKNAVSIDGLPAVEV